jgi:hypothetical protein
LAVAIGRFDDKLGEDAVRFADRTALGDPVEISLALVPWDDDGAETYDHAEAPVFTSVSGRGTLENHRHSTRS